MKRLFKAVYLEKTWEVDALQKLKQKLKSQTGASITFALLLFLVCAVVGSVVLTAGTAAAGRLSELAESDQRYYSVTSAAQLLRTMVERETVTIVKTDKSTDASAGSSSPDMSEDTAYPVYTINGDTIYPSSPSVELDSFPKDAAYSYVINNETEKTKTITLKVDGYDSLSTTIEETLSEDGTLTFRILSQQDRNGSQYALSAVYTADIKKNTGSNAYTGEVIEITKIGWRLAEMVTVKESGTS